MITIWKTPIVATVEQVLKDLKLQLYGAGLLKEIKNTGSDLMCTCPFHANGKEHNPSCGVLLQQKVQDMTPYDRAVRISLYSNRVGKMEEQKDHTEDPEAVKALEEKIKETQGLIDELLELFL